jgi:hypothetical protein
LPILGKEVEQQNKELLRFLGYLFYGNGGGILGTDGNLSEGAHPHSEGITKGRTSQ